MDLHRRGALVVDAHTTAEDDTTENWSHLLGILILMWDTSNSKDWKHQQHSIQHAATWSHMTRRPVELTCTTERGASLLASAEPILVK